MGDWKEAIKINLRRNKLTAMFLASIFLFSLAYIGIGYTVASQGISANPGCGMWASNTPDNWTTDDDWQSFEPWNDSEERIDIRKNFDVSNYQYQYENATFEPRGESGITLRGWYIEVDPNAPVVIQTHGMPQNGKCKPEMLLMQAYLAESGINSLSFDLRNYGESDVVSDYVSIGQKEYKDILGAYDWLIKEKGYSPGEVGMTAFSLGGGAAIAFADEPGIGALWLDSAVLDFPLVIKNELDRLGFPSSFAGPGVRVGGWLAGVSLTERSPLEAADNAGDRPVFLTHGKEDPRVSIEHSQIFEEKMISNGANVTTWYVNERGHVDALWGNSEEYQLKLNQFFTSSLN